MKVEDAIKHSKIKCDEITPLRAIDDIVSRILKFTFDSVGTNSKMLDELGRQLLLTSLIDYFTGNSPSLSNSRTKVKRQQEMRGGTTFAFRDHNAFVLIILCEAFRKHGSDSFEKLRDSFGTFLADNFLDFLFSWLRLEFKEHYYERIRHFRKCGIAKIAVQIDDENLFRVACYGKSEVIRTRYQSKTPLKRTDSYPETFSYWLDHSLAQTGDQPPTRGRQTKKISDKNGYLSDCRFRIMSSKSLAEHIVSHPTWLINSGAKLPKISGLYGRGHTMNNGVNGAPNQI